MRISDWSSDVCSSDLSHATTHLIQVEDLALEDTVRAARSLVIVDDECSTGNTYVAVANAMLETMPNLELIATCCITDWSGRQYTRNMRSEEHTSELQSLIRT